MIIGFGQDPEASPYLTKVVNGRAISVMTDYWQAYMLTQTAQMFANDERSVDILPGHPLNSVNSVSPSGTSLRNWVVGVLNRGHGVLIPREGNKTALLDRFYEAGLDEASRVTGPQTSAVMIEPPVWALGSGVASASAGLSTGVKVGIAVAAVVVGAAFLRLVL